MRQIAPSELIINDRGAVYHLNLRPEELAPLVICVGDPGRVKMVADHFDEVEHRHQHREFITHTGRIGKKRISVLSTGIGPDNIDIVLNELDALVNIDLDTRQLKTEHRTLQILRFGTSGSLQGDIPVDSLVAGTHGLGMDNLMHFYRFENHVEEKQLLQAFNAHTQLHERVTPPYLFSGSAALLRHFGTEYHKGITVTCPGFYGPQGRVLRLGLRYPELNDLMTSFRFGPHRISNFEMETSAIYGLGRLLGHQCLSLNAIVANRVTREFSKDHQATVSRLIRTSLEILEKVPGNP
jgi:uridine phosphorylase